MEPVVNASLDQSERSLSRLADAILCAASWTMGTKGHRLFIANDRDTSRIDNVGPDIGNAEFCSPTQ
jgi:hypothetical protein